MKKIFFLLMMLTCGLGAAMAQDDSRLLITAGQFKNIVLGEGMKVVLIGTDSQQTEIKGNEAFFEKVNVSVANGSLHIRPGHKLGKATVYVMVNNLQKLTVGQSTQVNTEGFLRSDAIKVYVSEGSIARLRTTGAVNGFSHDGDVVITRLGKPLSDMNP